MKRCLKYGLYVLGTLALMYVAFMLPILLSRITGTWAFFSARAESSPITITTGFWEDDEPIPDDDQDDNSKDKDNDKDEKDDEDNDDQGIIQVNGNELNLELQTEDTTYDVNMKVPDQTIVTEGQAPDQSIVTEGNSNAESTIATE